MKLVILLVAFGGYVVTIDGSHEAIIKHPGGIGGIFKGPDSETIVKGPDGSIITSQEIGGAVQTHSDLEPIIVAEPEVIEPIPNFINSDDGISPSDVANVPLAVTAAPIEVGVPIATVSAAPVLQAGASIITPVTGQVVEIIERDPHIIQTEIVDAPVIEPEQSSDLIGPSGSISTRGSSSIVSGPASTTISEPARVLVATPIVSAVPVVASVTTPLFPSPIVEVNHEIPLPSSSVLVNPVSTVTGSATVIHPENITPGIKSEASYGENVIINVPQTVSTLAPPINEVRSSVAPPTYWEYEVAPGPQGTDFVNSGSNIPISPFSSAPPISGVSSSTLAPSRSWNTEENIQVQPQPILSSPVPISIARNYPGNIGPNVPLFSSTPAPDLSRISISNSAHPESRVYSQNFEIQPQLSISTPSSNGIERGNAGANILFSRSSSSTLLPPRSWDSDQNIQIQQQAYGIRGADIGNISPTSSASSSTLAPPRSRDLEQNVQIQQQSFEIRGADLGNIGLNIPQPTSTISQANSWEPEQNARVPLPTSVSTQGDKLNQLFVSSPQPEINNNIASVQTTSSYGFTNNFGADEPVLTTARPRATVSSTIASPYAAGLDRNTSTHNIPQGNLQLQLEQAIANNRQLTINPSRIPSRNIVPPEIGPFPRAPGFLSASPVRDIKKINQVDNLIADNNKKNTNGRLENVNRPSTYFVRENQIRNQDDVIVNNQIFANSARNKYQTQTGGTGSNTPLLRNSNPIRPHGVLDSELGKLGIDSSQINFEKIPLSSVASFDRSAAARADVYQDTSTELWNRYGRDVNNKH